jgi:hypothetical protein
VTSDPGPTAVRGDAGAGESQTMPPLVVNAAMLSCTMGLGPPVPLTALPKGPPVTAGGQQVATIVDVIPMANIPMFGMCSSPANPAVAAATSAALGVLTPMPCVPVPTGPWAPGSAKVVMSGVPVLTLGSTCQCAFAGTISIGVAGQATVNTTG